MPNKKESQDKISLVLKSWFEKAFPFVEKGNDKMNNFFKLTPLYYQSSYIISLISLVIVYFFYLLSFILSFIGIDIWSGTAMIFFITSLFFYIIIMVLQLLNGFNIPSKEQYKLQNLSFKNTIKLIIYDLLKIFCNIIIILPIIISVSLTVALSLIHFGENTKNITNLFKFGLEVWIYLIFIPLGIVCLSRVFFFVGESGYYFGLNLSRLTVAFFSIVFTSFLIILFTSLFETMIKEYYTDELFCEEDKSVCKNIIQETSGNYVSLYRERIAPFFVFNDKSINIAENKNRFWFLALLIHILLVVILLVFKYLIISNNLFYKLLTLKDDIDGLIEKILKNKLDINRPYNDIPMGTKVPIDTAYPIPQGYSVGGSKKKIKSKRK